MEQRVKFKNDNPDHNQYPAQSHQPKHWNINECTISDLI